MPSRTTEKLRRIKSFIAQLHEPFPERSAVTLAIYVMHLHCDGANPLMLHLSQLLDQWILRPFAVHFDQANLRRPSCSAGSGG